MRGNGGYKIRDGIIYVYGNIDGKRYRISTKKKATQKNINWVKRHHWSVLLKLIDKTPKEKSMPLKDFALEVLEVTSHKRDESTQKDYISKLKRMILPNFEKFELKDIKPIDIEKWQNTLLQTYSTTTVKRVRNLFGMIFKKAIANDMISKNPMDFVENVSVRHVPQEPYTIDEMKSIMSNSTGWLKMFLYLAFTTGLRPGELLALKWEDVDYPNKIIHLKRTMFKGKIKESSKTKNHNRLIIVADFVLDMLQSHQSSSINKEWIFTSSLNKPFSEPKAISNRHFKPFLEKIGVTYKGLKATRHTYISIMRNDGVDVDLILEIAGHSKEVQNKHYYTAMINPKKIKAVNNVFNSFSNLKDTIKAHAL